MVATTEELMSSCQNLAQEVGTESKAMVFSAVKKFHQMRDFCSVLLPQILSWLETTVVAKEKLIHPGITDARAIVKNKSGKRLEAWIEVVADKSKRWICFRQSSFKSLVRNSDAATCSGGLSPCFRLIINARNGSVRPWSKRPEDRKRN
jgi:hypothetical protein